MPKLVFDIETVGEDFESMDEKTQSILTAWIKETSTSEEDYQKRLQDVKARLGLSPLTGFIVAIGVYDVDKDQGAVYFQAPNAKIPPEKDSKFKFQTLTEREILEKFWEIAKTYDEFITFNGRSFDVPFILLRSAIHKIKPTKDLMANRYLSSQRFNAAHIDLFDQLTFYGALQTGSRKLHMFCRAFNIKSPKSEGVDGSDVSKLFEEAKFLDIAKYNSLDLVATKELYLIWKDFLKS